MNNTADKVINFLLSVDDTLDALFLNHPLAFSATLFAIVVVLGAVFGQVF